MRGFGVLLAIVVVAAAAWLFLRSGSPENAPGAVVPVRPAGPEPPPGPSAALTARVLHRGPVPKRATISMTIDAECSALHPAGVLDASLVVGPAGEVENAIVFVSSPFAGRAFPPPTSPVEVDQKGCLYLPRVVTAMTGQTVAFRNSDPFTHNVHGIPAAKGNKEFNRGQRNNSAAPIAWVAAAPEIFPVKCEIHPWMTAWVGVFDHPYHAVTGADGRATLPALPVGEYEVSAWHEAFRGKPPAPKRVKLVEGAPLDVEFVLEAGETK